MDSTNYLPFFLVPVRVTPSLNNFFLAALFPCLSNFMNYALLPISLRFLPQLLYFMIPLRRCSCGSTFHSALIFQLVLSVFEIHRKLLQTIVTLHLERRKM